MLSARLAVAYNMFYLSLEHIVNLYKIVNKQSGNVLRTPVLASSVSLINLK